MLIEVEGHHNRSAGALHFMCFGIDDTLCQVKTLGSDFRYGSLYGNVVGAVDLCKELSLNVYNDDAIFLPIDVRAYGGKVLGLSQIVKGEIDRVVDMAEFIDIIEA